MNSVVNERRLDLTERLFYMMNRYGFENSIYMLGCRGSIDRAMMEKSISIIVRIYPARHSVITMGDAGDPSFLLFPNLQMPRWMNSGTWWLGHLLEDISFRKVINNARIKLGLLPMRHVIPYRLGFEPIVATDTILGTVASNPVRSST